MIAPTVGVALMLSALGGFAAWYVHRLQRDTAAAQTKNVAKVTAGEELVIISHDLRHALSEYVADGDRRHLETVPIWQESAKRWIEECENLAQSDAESELVRRIKDGYERFQASSAAIASADSSALATKSLLDRTRQAIDPQILDPVLEYRRLTGKQMRQAVEREQVLAHRMGIGLLVLGVCGAVAGLVAGVGFAQSVHRSIIQFSVPVHDAAGKLNEIIGPIDVSAETLGDLETTMQVVANHVGMVVQRLQRSQEVARRAEQLAALGQLAAGIAHELRNPLTSMKIIVQTAADQTDGATLDGRDLAVLTEEITRLENRIQSFLDFARPAKLVKRPLRVHEVLSQTIDFVSYRTEQIGIRIEREFPEHTVEVQADAGQLREVLLNLLINAIDASPENGKVRVRLSYETCPNGAGEVSPAQRASSWIQIDVEDQGEGLPSDIGEKIFEPFVSTKESGTGLGLPVCKRIIEDHGGQITAANSAGGGAVFSVRLPLDRQESRECPHS
jgi:signal transduction histidine kinase